MKIFLINPNSDESMARMIQKAAADFAAGQYEVVCKSTPGAPRFIESYQDQIRAGPGMLQLVRENEDQYDGFVVTCHYDPNLDAVKEITARPVVGIGEASLRIASMLGHSFSLITTEDHSIALHEELIRKYHLAEVMASVRAPAAELAAFDEREKFLRTARAALDEDRAEVIVLGCAGLSGLDKFLQTQLNVPVLDGVICGLFVAAGLVKYGVSTSKIRRYNPDY
ncbi:MAG: Asp/Glu/hydantoin racemase [Phycisphaerae bacterium SM23_30]|nr:MAG: Asp/Glu/hydantoin racemase [Phycisphaerae bacterium SM23_30]